MNNKYNDLEKVVDNYINGNISDFKEALSLVNKKELLLIITSLAERLAATNDYEYKTYSDNGYYDAMQTVYKFI